MTVSDIGYAPALGRPDRARATAEDFDNLVEPPKEPIRFLSLCDVAAYLGLKNINSLSGVRLPPHDVEIGNRKGWLPQTIDTWKAARPGRGRWGPRLSKGEMVSSST